MFEFMVCFVNIIIYIIIHQRANFNFKACHHFEGMGVYFDSVRIIDSFVLLLLLLGIVGRRLLLLLLLLLNGGGTVSLSEVLGKELTVRELVGVVEHI
jgi:hypothetical protein